MSELEFEQVGETLTAPVSETASAAQAAMNQAHDEAKPKRRGRPPKDPNAEPKKRRSKKTETESLDAFAKQIQGIHHMASLVTGVPEAAISDVESRMLAESVIAVSEEYGFELSGKSGASLQLLAACAMVYTPRFIQASQRLNRERQNRIAAMQEAEREANHVPRPDEIYGHNGVVDNA